MIGFYDYTVVLTYISMMISVYGITLCMDGHFKRAIVCLALSGLCDMFDGKIARTKKTERMKKMFWHTDRFTVRYSMFWYIANRNML